MINCRGCKWAGSDDRNRLCPICNSNYDMWEPNENKVTADKIKQVADILKKQKTSAGFNIKILENTLMEDGQAVLLLSPSDYIKYFDIKNQYDLLLKSGMFFEFHPELTGDYEKDRDAWTVIYQNNKK